MARTRNGMGRREGVVNFLRDHQWKIDNRSEPEDEVPDCPRCGEMMEPDLFGEYVCQKCEEEKQNDDRNQTN